MAIPPAATPFEPVECPNCGAKDGVPRGIRREPGRLQIDMRCQCCQFMWIIVREQSEPRQPMHR